MKARAMRIKGLRSMLPSCILFLCIIATAAAQQYQNPLEQRPAKKSVRRSLTSTATKTATAATPAPAPQYVNPLDLRPVVTEPGSGNGRTALDRRPKGVPPLAGDAYSFPAKATPPPQLAPDFTRNSTLRAAEKHPDLVVRGSVFNQRFTDAVTILQSSSPEFFGKGDWPEQLADRVAAEIEKEATALVKVKEEVEQVVVKP